MFGVEGREGGREEMGQFSPDAPTDPLTHCDSLTVKKLKIGYR